MARKQINITTHPVADNYATHNERIIEFSAGNYGTGGLISLRYDSTTDHLTVELYRVERTTVLAPHVVPPHAAATPPLLTVDTALALAAIAQAARDEARVARVLESGAIVYGTARSIADGDDIRTMDLRVTTDAGVEVYWPMADLIADIKVGNFVVNPVEGIRA